MGFQIGLTNYFVVTNYYIIPSIQNDWSQRYPRWQYGPGAKCLRLECARRLWKCLAKWWRTWQESEHNIDARLQSW